MALEPLQIESWPTASGERRGYSGFPGPQELLAQAVKARSATAELQRPNSGSSVYQFTFAAPAVAAIRASQVEVCWNSQSNVTYQVQYRSDLTTNLWTSLVDCIRSTNSTSCIADPVVVGQPQRFYRVVLTNCVP